MGYRFGLTSLFHLRLWWFQNIGQPDFLPLTNLKKKRKCRVLQGLLGFLEWRGFATTTYLLHKLCQLLMGVLGCDCETHFNPVWIPGFWLLYLGAWHYKRIQNWWDSSLYWWFDKLMQILLDFIVVRMHTV